MTSARNKDLPTGFDLRFLSLYIYTLVPIDILVFQFFSNCKKTDGFRLFYRNSWNPYQKSIKLILPDVFWESVMCLRGEFLHGWVPYCFCPPEVKKWPAELVYKVTSLASTNNADLFPSQGRNIWNKYLIPALYQSPAFESRTADNQQIASAQTEEARLILKKDSESA